MTTEIIPVAYKFKAKKDGIITEFLSLKEIRIEDAQKKINDFLECFKIVSVRRESSIESKTPYGPEGTKHEEYSPAKSRLYYILEFAEQYSEFSQTDLSVFLKSKGLKLKRRAVNDDMQRLKRKGIIVREGRRKWKFIVPKESIRSMIDTTAPITMASIPKPRQRIYMMYRHMSDRKYFTIIDWADFMASPPNNYDNARIKNNFYHDIADLLSQSKAEEIRAEDDKSYSPKRYRIIRTEPQAVEDRVLQDLRNGQKALLGTIK